MKREIKFKCWHELTGEMYDVYGFNNDHVYIDTLDSPDPGVNIFPRHECELLQFIGLKDKNGVEIFENHIVTDGVCKYEVVYSYTGFSLKRGICYHRIDNDIEIIGDIHHNPELI